MKSAMTTDCRRKVAGPTIVRDMRAASVPSGGAPAWLNARMPDPRKLGFPFFVDAAKQATAKQSVRVRVLDETQLRERFNQVLANGS
jgi:hypothetical protein